MIYIRKIDQQRTRPICQKSLCWRQDLAVPHESIWCRLNKMELLNRAKLKLLEDELRNPRIVRNATYARGWANCDLLVLGFRDREKLKGMSAPGCAPTAGALVDYISTAEENRWIRDAWASKQLRYCPLCVKAGVHVTYFQFKFLRVCPVHRVRLVSYCPSCKATIGYTIREQSSARRFACHCGHRLWNWEDNPTNAVTSAIKTGHAKAGDWICRALKWGSFLYCAWDADEEISQTMGREGLQTFATFAALAGPSLGKLSGNFQSGLAARLSTTRFHAPRCQAYGQQTSERKQLIAIYKSICRYFYSRYLRRHRKAIKVVAKIESAPWIGIDGNITWPRPFALVAMAFVGWRMYWECVVSPDELFRFHKPFRRIDNFTSERSHWTLKTIERFYRIARCPKVNAPKATRIEIKKRWFAQTCFCVFDECLVRVKLAFENFKPRASWINRRFTTEKITGALCPIMVPTIGSDGAVTLHWWRRPTTARQTKWAIVAFRTPPSRKECAEFNAATHRIIESTSRTSIASVATPRAGAGFP